MPKTPTCKIPTFYKHLVKLIIIGGKVDFKWPEIFKYE